MDVLQLGIWTARGQLLTLQPLGCALYLGLQDFPGYLMDLLEDGQGSGGDIVEVGIL
jgi:hypothetical protein